MLIKVLFFDDDGELESDAYVHGDSPKDVLQGMGIKEIGFSAVEASSAPWLTEKTPFQANRDFLLEARAFYAEGGETKVIAMVAAQN